MRLVFSSSVNVDAIVVRIVSTLNDDVDVAIVADGGGNTNDTDADADAFCVVSSPLNASSIEEDIASVLPLSRVKDNAGNVASTTCSVLMSFGIVFDTTNSFIFPLKWLLLFVKLVLFSTDVMLLLFPLKLLLAMTPVFQRQRTNNMFNNRLENCNISL